MRVIISLPKRIFHEAAWHARRSGKSRSQLYVEALTEYFARHAAEADTDAMNRLRDDLGNQPDALVSAASQHLLRQESW